MLALVLASTSAIGPLEPSPDLSFAELYNGNLTGNLQGTHSEMLTCVICKIYVPADSNSVCYLVKGIIGNIILNCKIDDTTFH